MPRISNITDYRMQSVAGSAFPSRRLLVALFQVVAMLFGLAGIIDAGASEVHPAWPGTVQAVRSDWNAQEPPTSGWIDVSLPDDWGLRWPDFDGVAWYRLTWRQQAPLDDTALYLENLSMAGEVRLNGAVLERDASLVEPLSRMWNVPRYWRLPSPLLREGENTLLVRVSGFAAYQAGLGQMHIGAAQPLYQSYEETRWLHLRLSLLSIGMGITLGAFFLVLWLLRRSEVAYGWYAAQQFAWFPVSWNIVATSPWPFATTPPYQAMTVAAVLVFSGCWAMFVLRFCERRWPRREALLWLMVVLGSIWTCVAPQHSRAAVRDVLMLLVIVINSAVDLMFLWFAWRGGRTDQRILSLFALVGVTAATHDVLVLTHLIDGDYTNYATLTEHFTVIGVALVLAWNFVRNLRRIEGFNRELQQNVDEARAELVGTLARQHELELVHARLGERVSLAHDLHDGLGGMLIGNIAAMEQVPDQQLPSRTVLGMLQELRDDLRLIIDTSSAQHYGEHSLADLLAPLRHRMTRLFEAHDIAVRWHVDGLEQVFLGNTQSLDVLRVLQEALTNVLKHANARRVEVELRNDATALLLEVRDDGKGMDTSAGNGAGAGTGMRSMQARARRLGASLTVGSEVGGTIVRMHRPWPIADGVSAGAALANM